MSPENPPPSEPLVLNVEELPRRHPAINAQLLLEHTRVALASHGASPSPMDVHWRGRTLPAQVHFQQPDPRSALTLQRPAFIELGAVALAGLVLPATSGLQLTRFAAVTYWGEAGERQHASTLLSLGEQSVHDFPEGAANLRHTLEELRTWLGGLRVVPSLGDFARALPPLPELAA